MSEQMSEQHHEEHGLSTADMARAPEARQPEQATPPAETADRRVAAEPRATAEAGFAPLLPDNEISQYRSRWEKIQTGFVDEPRESVQHADELVAQIMQRLASTFADERSKLEAQWSRGENVSTEDLRVALQRYRSFFDRLLSI